MSNIIGRLATKSLFAKQTRVDPRPRCLLVGFRSQAAVTGLSLAFELLLAGLQERQLAYRLIDLGMLWNADYVGRFTLSRAFIALKILWLFCIHIRSTANVYITIASSRVGFLRDAFLIWIGRLYGRRLILHLHGAGYQHFYQAQPVWLQRFIALTLAQVDRILVLGEALRHHFDFVPGFADKVQVVHNGLPLGVSSDMYQAKTYARTEPLRLLYLSNMLQSKGYLKLLAACRILHHERNIPLYCDFCGDFIQTPEDAGGSSLDAQQYFCQLIHEWGLAEHVVYHGRVLGSTKQKMLQQAHLLVLPTTYPWEGQPLSIIEALAMGVPIIATPQAAIPEQVHDGYNGFLIAAEAVAIANAVEQVWRAPDQYAELSKNARNHYLKHFTSERHLEQIIPIIIGNV